MAIDVEGIESADASINLGRSDVRSECDGSSGGNHACSLPSGESAIMETLKSAVTDGKPRWARGRVRISFINRKRAVYRACSQRGCNKKLEAKSDGDYECKTCSNTPVTFKWRMLLEMRVRDAGETLECIAFNEVSDPLRFSLSLQEKFLRNACLRVHDREGTRIRAAHADTCYLVLT